MAQHSVTANQYGTEYKIAPRLTRRGFLTGMACSGPAVTALIGQSRPAFSKTGGLGGISGTRTMPGIQAFRMFELVMVSNRIGTHVIDAGLDGRHFFARIVIDIEVTILGFTAYRYKAEKQEIWKDRILQSVSAETDDDGDQEYCRVRNLNGKLQVDGSQFRGDLPETAVTSSYYAPEFLERAPWISTKSGKVLDIEKIRLDDDRLELRGDIDGRISYRNDNWSESYIDAKGRRIFYELRDAQGDISALWRDA